MQRLILVLLIPLAAVLIGTLVPLLSGGFSAGSPEPPSTPLAGATEAAPTPAPTTTTDATSVVPQLAASQTSDDQRGGSETRYRTIYAAQFAADSSQWPSNRSSTAWLADGVYHLAARQAGQFVAIGAPLERPLSDVVVTATFRKTGGPSGGGYGLIVRDSGPGPRDGLNQRGRFYVLEAGDLGQVGIWRRETDKWIDLVPWTLSAAVRASGPNEVAAQAVGSRLTFLVNQTEVASVVDAVLTDGGVGIFVGGDSNEVELSQFLVQVPAST